MEERPTKSQIFWSIFFAVVMGWAAVLTWMQELPEPFPSWAHKVAEMSLNAVLHISITGVTFVGLAAMPLLVFSILLSLSRRV